jgi:hypothetical protein
MPGLTCETCRFWQQWHGSQGFCRRYAPKPAVVDGERVDTVYWPDTNGEHDWCGEHEPRPESSREAVGE